MVVPFVRFSCCIFVAEHDCRPQAPYRHQCLLGLVLGLYIVKSVVVVLLTAAAAPHHLNE